MVEPNADLSVHNTSGHLWIEGKSEFTDVDELIVNRVQAMARRVEELMAHDKFKKEEYKLSESSCSLQDDFGVHQILGKFLTDFVAANPAKSIYGFCLNRKRPGHFNLSFPPRKGTPIQTWVRNLT